MAGKPKQLNELSKKWSKKMTTKYTFSILEETGEIDCKDLTFGNDLLALQYAARFLSVFENDPFHRVARVSRTGRVLFNYDSLTGVLTYGRK